MYKVIGTSKSRALRVIWMLNELGEPFEQISVAPGSVEAGLHSPTGKLPALVDGEAVLTDSVAIMTYLADKHGKLTAAPGTIARANQDAMGFWIIDEMDSVLRFAEKLNKEFPEAQIPSAIRDTLKRDFVRASQTLSSRLQGAFLMGDTLTLPDILACHCLIWAVGAKFPRADRKLGLYAKALRDRPAFKAALAS